MTSKMVVTVKTPTFNAMGIFKMPNEVVQAGYTSAMSVAFGASIIIAVGPVSGSRLHIDAVLCTDMSHEIDGIPSLVLPPTAVTNNSAHYILCCCDV